MVIRSLRWMRGVTLKNRKSSEKLLLSLGILSVGDMVRQERSRCSGHIERKDRSDWVSACRDTCQFQSKMIGERVEKLGCSA